MALGTSVLGGIVAGPALLIAGGLYAKKAEENLDNAISYLREIEKYSEELKVAEQQLDNIISCASDINEFFIKFNDGFIEKVDNLISLTNKKTDWKLFSKEEKLVVAIATKEAKFLKALIDKPLLSDDGLLTDEIKKINKKMSTMSRESLINEM